MCVVCVRCPCSGWFRLHDFAFYHLTPAVDNHDHDLQFDDNGQRIGYDDIGEEELDVDGDE